MVWPYQICTPARSATLGRKASGSRLHSRPDEHSECPAIVEEKFRVGLRGLHSPCGERPTVPAPWLNSQHIPSSRQRLPTACVALQSCAEIYQPTVVRIYSILRCLHHISAALRLRCTSSDPSLLGSLTSFKAFLPSSYSTRKSGTYLCRRFRPSIQSMEIPCLFIHLTTCVSRSRRSIIRRSRSLS